MSAARFKPGELVRVRASFPPGHTRTPYYTRGCVGTIVSVAGCDRNPEQLAYGVYDAPSLPLYRVRIQQPELWRSYAGNPRDSVVVDIFEHWLEAFDHA